MKKEFNCGICNNKYQNCQCSDKEHRLHMVLNPEIKTDFFEGKQVWKRLEEDSKKRDEVDKTTWQKSHPTSTWCTSCNAPRNTLICPVCGEHLFPNFHMAINEA